MVSDAKADGRLTLSETVGGSESASRESRAPALSPPLVSVSLAELAKGLPRAHQFSLTFLKEHSLYPYELDDRPKLAAASLDRREIISTLALSMGGTVELQLASPEDIEFMLDNVAASETAARDDSNIGSLEVASEDVDSLRDLASGAPVVKALEDILERAVSMRATDIHIEPRSRDLIIRVRVDGVLRNIPAPREIAARAIVSRIKILASLNIAERRLPQDGHLQANIRKRDFDIRVATMPTTAGEAAILRLLDRSGKLVDFDQLGFNDRDRSILSKTLAQPHGMLIVTGPTGSGKTTTLAASLAQLNDGSRKLLTIEDPVEYEIDGVSQSQVRPAIGLTFASGLRAFLRQDPDVIMVGEVRDPETAQIALQAALTGHLVLTTLHTNTSVGAITRLADIGTERYLIAATLTAVVGQRLFRTLCTECREPFTVTDAFRESNPRLIALQIPRGVTLHRARGCERCSQTGYRGRRAIFEVLEVSESIRREILAGAPETAVEKVALSEGMTTMLEDGRARCLSGITTVDEIFRVAALR